MTQQIVVEGKKKKLPLKCIIRCYQKHFDNVVRLTNRKACCSIVEPVCFLFTNIGNIFVLKLCTGEKANVSWANVCIAVGQP